MGTFISYDDMREMADMREQGLGYAEIGKLLGLHRGAVRSRMVQEDRMDLLVDRVAVDRALQGDWRVYENLTYWEGRIVLDTIRDWPRSQRDNLYQTWAARDPNQPAIIASLDSLLAA